MPILNPNQVTSGSSVPTTKVLPDGYEYRKSAEGDLQVWKVDVTPNVLITSQNVGEFDVNGSLRAAINTIYLEEAHSIKSSGEEVVFKNLESNIFFTPLWQYTSENGESVGEAGILVEDPAPTDYFQNGAVDTGLNVPCVDTYTTTDNGSVYQFIVKAGEDYSGKVILELRNSLNKAVFREERNFNVTVGQDIVFDKLLYRVRVGNTRSFTLLKEDRSVLLVKSGLDNTKPWVKIVYRGFQDRKVVHLDASGKIPTSELPQIDTVERNTVANQAARLALPVSTKFRITIQNDVQRQFYLDPNLDPSVSSNWVDGGSVASAVTSFNGRTGNVLPQTGDYSAVQVGAVAVPANDGARRVLIGSSPTLENIVNDLVTNSALQPLSAAQGKVLQDTKQVNITGAATSITSSNLIASRAMASDASGKVTVSTVTSTELGHVSGVTSPIQTQLNGKQSTITGGATSIISSNLTTNRALISDSSGKVGVSSVTNTELEYLTGTSSAVQTQLNNKVDKTHTKRGYDLTVNTQPQAVYRDKFLTSGLSTATITASNIPWVYTNIDAAESSLPYWIQELTTFFKNLENDTQFDQIIGGIPANFSIPQGSWGVAPNGGTDMDNQIGSTTTYASESFEFIVGRNNAATEVYTFGFTFSQFANATYDTTALNPFRIIYQTTRGASSGFNGQTISGISNGIPRCTARSSSFTVSSYLSTGFPLMYEPIVLEINK